MGYEARSNPLTGQTTVPLVVREHRNRELHVGDEILLNVPGPIFWRVVDIRPNLDPKLPLGLVLVDIAATVTFTCDRGARNLEFILVRTAEQAGPMPLRRLTEDEVKEP
jgi:hypothetical protein